MATTETKKTGHTPGPWRVTDSSGVADGDDTLLAEAHQGVRRGADEAHANAVLIAAAPDMLDALTIIAERSGHITVLDGKSPVTHAAHCPSCVARAAIAKATGEGL